ncbi:MAG: hypothetical protein P8P18_02945 [Schleiferiaceae bacterium]|mgnify:FL=1|jgi:hypothetical protein|nr:hypothetical protein [Schleiferiaceae bacterium]MDG1313151.1 hypothetical protein [Schleiferiaceae bacterium]MDG2110562.1 hypothetical protein [Schleiferiaceae bacterium]
MKNFINSVRKSGPLRTKDNFIITPSMVDANGQLSIWNLMQLLNEVKGGRMNQLLLNVRFEDRVKNMDLKIYDNASLQEELVVESSFAPSGKRTVDLKIYVSRRKKGMPVKRVCKAVYTLGIHAAK